MIRHIGFLFLAIVCALQSGRVSRAFAPVEPRPAAAVTAGLVFERNQGQAPDAFQLIGRSGTYDMAFAQEYIGLAFKDMHRRTASVSLVFQGAETPTISAERQLDGYVNYIRGPRPNSWLRGVPTYERVRYAGLYDGIDAVFYGSDRQLEYDLEVAPRADPTRIALTFHGADAIDLDADGSLVVTTGNHTFTQRSPVAYQQSGQRRQHVAASYRVESDRVTIALGPYDRERPLVIDPVIAYATLLGGSSGDTVSAIAADRSGHAFVTGFTCSVDFPNTHATTKLPNEDQDDCDLYVTKMAADGRSFIYSTIIGGSSFDQGASIAVDPTGAAYVTGATSSADFPTTAGALDASCGETGLSTRCPEQDAFVIKLNPAGSALVYSTYLGGARSDAGLGIAVNARGAAFVTGWTSSADFPTTPTAFSRRFQASDAFLTILLANGGLSYSTLIGGRNTDQATSIAVDGGDNAYIAGWTGSPDFPIKGGFQKTMTFVNNAGSEGWVAKFDARGVLAFSSYFGGDRGDIVQSIAVHSSGIYIGGLTTSSTIPGATAGGSDTNTVGFVSQITGSGSRLIATRVLAAPPAVRVGGVAISGGVAHVVGDTSSAGGFPTTADAPQPMNTRGTAVFYTTWPIEPSGVIASRPSFSTVFSGGGASFGGPVTSDAAGGVFLGGLFFPPGFPYVNAAQGPGSTAAHDSEGAFVAHFAANDKFTSTDARDIVLWAADATRLEGDWTLAADPAAAGGRRLFEPDRGQVKVTAPASSPIDYAELTFTANAGVPYRLWIRAMAQKNSFNNDSVWVQFSDSVDQHGQPLWRIGTASATPITLEDCTNCGLSGWGWQDNGFGVSVLGPVVRFAASGPHTIRIQRREDGISIDQVLLSNNRYLSAAPGTPKDTTIVLPKTVVP
ncbi:MAG: hypothetical protein JWL71_1855 [Acidobacteria bacterium]|nr:hypothetical protein [Acidobacteriota bacterium]